jgi:DNA-binding Lrp family transcriptional regulator
MQIDEKDEKLIRLLAENARRSVSELSRDLNVARTTVQARIERLETLGVIAGYTLKLGAAVGPALRATVLLSIEPKSGPAVLQRLKSLTQVERVHTASGRFDLIVELVARSTEELDETLDLIGETRGVRGSESLIHLSTKINRAT